LHAPRCIITPHVAWTTLEARRRLVQITVENVAALIAGRPVRVVNA
jgi:glycerate dehydrogenase